MMTQFFIFCLMACAAWVCVCQAKKINPWPWIVAYWAILTVKNMVDFLGTV